ncbi:ABC-type glycerol-3-phosphate transport system permease component [Bacillus sp. 3255]|nr:ABC-type glycerol-3-phosphate transport system permease component [Bacillus sp. 3255]
MKMSRTRLSSFSNHVVLTAISLLMLYPVIWWLGASLKKIQK